MSLFITCNHVALKQIPLNSCLTITLSSHSSFLLIPKSSSTARSIQPDSRAIQRKLVARLQNIRIIPGAINLLLAPPPLGLINSINPILDLHNNATVLGNRSRSIRHIEQSLRALERHAPILPSAAIDLECVLIGEDVDLDTGPGAAEASDGALLAPVVGPVLGAVGEVAGIVAGAVEAAVSQQIWVCEVGADLLG